MVTCMSISESVTVTGRDLPQTHKDAVLADFRRAPQPRMIDIGRDGFCHSPSSSPPLDTPALLGNSI